MEEFDADETRLDRGPVDNFLQPQEAPLQPGTLVGTDAPEFETHAAGQLVEVSALPSANPDDITIRYPTHRVTHQPTASSDANHSGLYRDPVRLRTAAWSPRIRRKRGPTTTRARTLRRDRGTHSGSRD